MNAWDTVLGQRALGSINSIAQDMDKIGRNHPTLRDQFAISIASSFVSGSTSRTPLGVANDVLSSKTHAEIMAKAAYILADAMLTERSKEN